MPSPFRSGGSDLPLDRGQSTSRTPRAAGVVLALLTAVLVTWAISTSVWGNQSDGVEADTQPTEGTDDEETSQPTLTPDAPNQPDADTTEDGSGNSAELASSVLAVSSGGEKLRDQTSLLLGDFLSETSGTIIVFVTVVMANDAEPVPPITVNQLEPFATVQKNEVGARRLMAFTVPAQAATPLTLTAEFAQTLRSAKVSWTATFTEGVAGQVVSNPGAALENLLTIEGSEGLFIAGMTIGTSSADTIEPDPAALGWQRGNAPIGQTYTQWGASVESLEVTWTKPAHAMGLSIAIDPS